MTTVTIITGTGAHADPWHGLDSTSAAVARVLAERAECRIVTTDELLAATPGPRGLGGSDLVVVNTSGDLAAEPSDSRAIVSRLAEYSGGGRPILALHSSVLAFADDPRWAALIGGRWEPGVTMHPQIGNALVQPADFAPFGVGDIAVYDERYTRLDAAADNLPVAFHTEDGLTHPLVWARPATATSGAVVYDGLGHGVESFDSPAHRDLLLAAVDWLVP